MRVLTVSNGIVEYLFLSSQSPLVEVSKEDDVYTVRTPANAPTPNVAPGVRPALGSDCRDFAIPLFVLDMSYHCKSKLTFQTTVAHHSHSTDGNLS
jgi:hypothetical protein